MVNDKTEYENCIKKKVQEYLKMLGKKTFTLGDLANATEWASEQCRAMIACKDE